MRQGAPDFFFSCGRHPPRIFTIGFMIAGQGYELGLRQFDAATGGCGGCNFAPGAEGNISTQAMALGLRAAGGVDRLNLAALNETQNFLEARLGKRLPYAE